MVPFFLGKIVNSGTNYVDMINTPYMTTAATLRLLRISFLPKILNASEVYSQLLMKKFPSKRQVIFNGKQIFSLILFLFLSLHLSACANLFSGSGENSWVPIETLYDPDAPKALDIYIS